MIKPLFKSILQYMALIILPMVIISCGESNSDSPAYNYIGPGSEYSLALDSGDSSFVVTESESGMVVNGTYSTLDSGFTLLTVSSATGDDAPTAGDKAFGIDVPGYMFLLKPISDDSDIIPMVSAGDCPTEDFTANWIVTSIDEGSNFESDCFLGSSDEATQGLDSLGTFSYTHSTSSGSLPTKYDICGTTLDSYSLGDFSCSGGKATIDDANLYLTQVGGMLVKIDPDDAVDEDHQIIVALPSQEIVDTNNFDGDYIGLILANDSSGSNVFPITGSFDTNTFSFDEVDPETNITTTVNNVNGDVNFSAVNSPSNGFMKGTFDLDSDGTPYKIICNSSYNIFSSGKNFIFCIGRTPDSETDDMFNALLISK